jgi:AraC family cel operon transcriptional repressor
VHTLAKLSDIPKKYIRNDFFYSYGPTTPPMSILHNHDFFEITFVKSGALYLTVNDKKIMLTKNSLTLIRPSDVHIKEALSDCIDYNTGFHINIFSSIFNYLGHSFDSDLLISSELPPTVILPEIYSQSLCTRFKEIEESYKGDDTITALELRIIVLELICKFYSLSHITTDYLYPSWLQHTLTQMNKHENFVEGIPALLRIAEKNHSYLSRSFKKHLQITPVNYINDLRLNYAANLLNETEMSILDISFESGFNNLSHFYHLFSRKYSLTPVQYRNINKRR